MVENKSDNLDKRLRQIESMLLQLTANSSNSLATDRPAIPLTDHVFSTCQIGPGLPSPDVLQSISRARQYRAKIFGQDLFADPAWDMILDLGAALGRNERISVTSLCLASGVPLTTALRWIKIMVDRGIFVRVEDEVDRRRIFVELSHSGKRDLERYFDEVAAKIAIGL